MNYRAADLLSQNLKDALDALVVPLPHQLYSHDALAPKGDKAFPPRPCISISIPQTQPALIYGQTGPRGGETLMQSKTRLMVLVETGLYTDDPAAQKQVNGYNSHLDACNFVRKFVLSTHSLAIPASLTEELGAQPYAMEPDTPLDGHPGRDASGWRHAYFVLVNNLEVLWPAPSP